MHIPKATTSQEEKVKNELSEELPKESLDKTNQDAEDSEEPESPELKALKNDLDDINLEDPDALERADSIMEKHTFKDVFKVYSLMYFDLCSKVTFFEEKSDVPPNIKEEIILMKDSFELKFLSNIYKDQNLAKYRNDNDYFSNGNNKKKKPGVYERLSKAFKKSKENFPDLNVLTCVKLAGVHPKTWRHIAMALDLLLTNSPNALKYAKQVLINSSLLEIYQRNGGDKLLENDPDGIFKCVEVIKDGIKNFNSVVEECILINEKN